MFPEGITTFPCLQGIDHVLGVQVVFEELAGIDIDDDRPHVRAERGDGDRAGDVLLHERPDDVLRQVSHRPDRGLVALAREHEVADRDAAGVHAHDHGRQGPRGHPRHGPVGHGHDLGHGLAHLGVVEEPQLAQADLLDVPRLDVLDAVDVLEIQLELVDDESLDLVGTHADEIEEDVDLRGVQRGEDVHSHLLIGQDAEADQAPRPASRA